MGKVPLYFLLIWSLNGLFAEVLAKDSKKPGRGAQKKVDTETNNPGKRAKFTLGSHSSAHCARSPVSTSRVSTQREWHRLDVPMFNAASEKESGQPTTVTQHLPPETQAHPWQS